MKKNDIALLVLQIFLGFGLAGYAYIGSFSRMLADDFCSAYYANRLGLLRSVWYWYISWSGRYSAFAADWFVLKVSPGPYAFHYIVPGMIILWLIFLTVIFYLAFRNRGPNAILHSTLLGSGFLFALFLLSPNIPQSLFWWNGARAYSLPLMLLTFCITLFQSARLFPKLPPKTGYGAGFILLFLIGGMGETYAIGQAGFIVFLIFMRILRAQKTSTSDLTAFTAGLAGAILSILVIILAPGNAVRQSFLPPSPGLGKLISVSVQGYAAYIHEFFIEPERITGLTGAILLYAWMGIRYQDHISSNVRSILMYILGGIALSFLCFPPGAYGYSEPPPSRTLIIPTYFLLACILYASYLTGGWLSGLSKNFVVKGNWVPAAALILMGYSTVINSIDLLNQRQNYADFAQKWDEVDRQILDAKAKNLGSVNIPAMNNWAYLEAPTDNPRYWVTRCYSNYYGIQVHGPTFEEVIEIYHQKGME